LVGLAQIGEQLVALLGIVITMAKAAVEAEGVVEVEAEGADNGPGKVLERPTARKLDIAIETAAQGGAENACAHIGHVRPLAGSDDAVRRTSKDREPGQAAVNPEARAARTPLTLESSPLARKGTRLTSPAEGASLSTSDWLRQQGSVTPSLEP
jgi:hypothetical protein